MIGEKLKQLRDEKKFTQQMVAENLGISRVTYTRYETGTREPDLNMLMKISDFYECDLNWLLGKYENSNHDLKLLVDNFKDRLMKEEGLNFDGTPLSEEDLNELLVALYSGMKKVEDKNKKYTTKKNK